jgi:hypothetical protein
MKQRQHRAVDIWQSVPTPPWSQTSTRRRKAAARSWLAFGERDDLVAEVEAWQRQHEASGARIRWTFITEKTHSTLAGAYPDTAKEPKLL